jgi:toxin-antitoxin system PIN domain toxin
LRRLLDINVLLALCDPNHIDHQRVQTWFAKIGSQAWASCPITQNGFVRILSNPAYPGLTGNVSAAATLLQRLLHHKGHEFWPDDYSIVAGAVDLNRATGSKQITDLYLLGLAVRRKGRFTSLDTRMPAYLVRGGEAACEIVSD